MTSKKALSMDSQKQDKTLRGRGSGLESEYYSIPDTVCDVNTLSILIRKKNVRVVDVRKEEEYAREHIPGAVSLPLAKILEKESPARCIELLQDIGVNEDLPVVTYDDTFGALAARVAWTFQYVGHQHSSILEVTFAQWKSMGFRTEKKINSYKWQPHPLTINHSIYADLAYVEKAASNTVLIDSRERLNFLSEHIPEAVNLPYTMLRADGKVLSKADDIRRLLQNRGIHENSELVTYCGSVGTLSGLVYYGLKLAGLKDVRLYAKSFKEWKALGKPKAEFKDANYWDLSAE
ncbi:MAG TPA: rhodanese-like domain-containing protein [Nitrososphaeraceae archaeon]|nr:rhodanese-like domain-containing protein [Nitrososphaeraceae archaeon]